MQNVRGSHPATIDDKGRLKLPARLKNQMEEWFGVHLFVTSLFPHEIRVYPLEVWEELEQRILAQPSMTPAIQRLLEHANYGQEDDMDAQGRVLIPALLRDVIGMSGEIVVSGRGRFLGLVARDRAHEVLSTSLSDEELSALAALEL